MRPVLSVTLLMLAAACSPKPPPPPPPQAALYPALQHMLQPDRPLNIAHRGGSKMGPEETLPAFQASVSAGADVLELDVHLSADGVPVCMHDALVDRTTDGVGAISEMTLAQLKQLDAGQGARVPTLEEVLLAFPDTPFVIELKQTDPPIVQPVLSLLQQLDATERVVLASFDDETLKAVRSAPQPPATSLGPTEVLSWLWLDNEDEADWHIPGRFLHLPPSVPGIDLTDPALIARAERMGMALQVWTITEAAQMQALIHRGVHGIMTPNPALLQQTLEASAPPVSPP